jgi:hypothetical protein
MFDSSRKTIVIKPELAYDEQLDRVQGLDMPI